MRACPARRRGRSAVFFDLFGTLIRPPDQRDVVDFLSREKIPAASPLFRLAVEHLAVAPLAASGGVPAATLRDFMLTRDLPSVEAIAHAMALAGWQAPNNTALRLAGRFQAYLDASYALDSGVIATLQELRANGIRTAVVTNVDSISLQVADRLGVAQAVDTLVASCAVGIAKPDPRIFQAAAERLGVAASQVVVVGDSWRSDVVGALAFGAQAVWIDRGDDPVAHLLFRHGYALVAQLLQSGGDASLSLRLLQRWRLPERRGEAPGARKPESTYVRRVANLAGARRVLCRLFARATPGTTAWDAA